MIAYYDESPFKRDERPVFIAFMQEVKEIQRTVSIKKTHFLIVLHNNNFIEVKTDNEEEMEQWISAINFFKEYYGKEKRSRLREYKESVDPETELKLCFENEMEKWDQLRAKYDYSDFFSDNDLLPIFQQFQF